MTDGIDHPPDLRGVIVVNSLIQSVESKRLDDSFLMRRASYGALFPCYAKFSHYIYLLGFLALFAAKAVDLLRSPEVLDRRHGCIGYIERV